MYYSNPNEPHKYSDAPAESAPPPPDSYGEPAAGIPVSSSTTTNHHFHGGQNTLLPSQQTNRPLVPWSTGLCDCMDDISSCCLTFWCPCITFGRIAEIVDKGSTSCGTSGALYCLLALVVGQIGCWPWCYSYFYRSKMRRDFKLHESPCCDCLVHFCCEPCAMCQEYRELKNQGFDMVIGWHGNVENKNSGVAMTPVAQQPMYK